MSTPPTAPRAVVVTGASSGIGRACALHLDSLGFDVLAGVRRRVDGDALRLEGSSRLVPVILDVTDPATIAALAATIGERPLAGLVNNAGTAVGGPLELVPVDVLRGQLEVNVVGLVAVTQALLPALRRGGGRIVNMGSVGGRHAPPFVGPYAASKFAVEAITDCLRQELRPWHMHVAVVEPGSIATPIWEKGRQFSDDFEADLSPRGRELYGDAILAMGRLTADVAARGLPPQRVARVVEHALTARRPRTRYVVGLEARFQILMKTLLSDRALDWVVARVSGIQKAPAGERASRGASRRARRRRRSRSA
jgi:NAD(P)-dependent dehydrogenase (short-subunit alcohol dehydrogenase family)